MVDQYAPDFGYGPATSVTTQHRKLGAFISYSRDDVDFADQLEVALRLWGFDTTLDRHAISGGEEWKQRLQNLIREADTVVFVLSPSSVNSSTCAWEVEEATRLGKRIIPVVCREFTSASVPPRLQDLNYIFFYKEPKSPDSGFGTGLAKLVEALNTDLEWLREHTRLFLRATEWETGGKPSNRLLSGSDVDAAKSWAARRPKGAPELTPLHLEFIRTSEEAEDERLRERRKELDDMANAQQERETALRSAESALNDTIRLKRRQAWAGAITATILAVIGWWAYGVIRDQYAVSREAARTDIRGQVIAYAAAFGSWEMDLAAGKLTSPYTTPLVEKLRQKKNLVEAIVDAHQQVLDSSKGEQRPLLSTSMNGHLYLHRQPSTRRKIALVVSAEEAGGGMRGLTGPPHDVEAFMAALIETGFAKADIIRLRNPDRDEIEAAVAGIKQKLRAAASYGAGSLHADQTSDLLVRTSAAFKEKPVNLSPENTLFVFFFSGHGVEVGGESYLIPKMFPRVNEVRSPEDIENAAVKVTWLTRMAEETAAASVLILDTHFPTIAFGSTAR